MNLKDPYRIPSGSLNPASIALKNPFKILQDLDLTEDPTLLKFHRKQSQKIPIELSDGKDPLKESYKTQPNATQLNSTQFNATWLNLSQANPTQPNATQAKPT